MPATKKTTSFSVACPFCGIGANDSDQSPIRIDLNDLDTITCSSCDEEFSVGQAVDKAMAQLERWQAVQRWVEMAADLTA